jgi:signal transduction histidine kinase/CheY-like chemotaxis protein
MLPTFTTAAQSSHEFQNSAADLLQTTSRTLVMVVVGVYMFGHFAAGMWLDGRLDWRLWLATIVLGVTTWLALSLLASHFQIAQAVWIIGLAAANTVALWVLQQPQLAFFYALLPLMAVVTVGWSAGILAEALIILILAWLTATGVVVNLVFADAYSVAIAGAVSGVIGWAASSTLVTATHWSLFSMRQAQRSLEETRQHRAQLAITLKDLDLAYYRLERANAALVAAWREADQAERSKAELVTYVSHEMRTPLNLIAGFSEMILTNPESYGSPMPGAYREDLNTIHHNAQHLLALVDDVLDLARIEVGKITLTRETVDVATLITETTSMVRDYLIAKKLELQVQIDGDLPPLWLDRLRVRQVMLNLLVNAARFTDQGYIRVTAVRTGAEVEVRISDTGQGIAPEDLARVFEEFRTTDKARQAWHSGAGLGLPISRKFIELHQGRMGVESTLGRGTTVWFTVPCPSAASEEAGPRPLLALPSRPGVYLEKAERILVAVHPDRTIAAMLQRQLEDYRVLVAASVAEGIALAQENHAIALLIQVDDTLPEVPGDLLVFQCALPNRQREAAELGAVDVLLKPVSAETLLAAVERVRSPVTRVLIVDDQAEMVQLFQRVLAARLAPEACLAAYDGAEALRLMRAARPDLILLDLNMPELTGQEVLAHMQADPTLADIPVIVVSALPASHFARTLTGRVQILRADGFQLGEVMQTLAATLNALAPGWHPLASRAEGPVAAPAASPV